MQLFIFTCDLVIKYRLYLFALLQQVRWEYQYCCNTAKKIYLSTRHNIVGWKWQVVVFQGIMDDVILNHILQFLWQTATYLTYKLSWDGLSHLQDDDTIYQSTLNFPHRAMPGWALCWICWFQTRLSHCWIMHNTHAQSCNRIDLPTHQTGLVLLSVTMTINY